MKKLLLLFFALLSLGGSKVWATDITVSTSTGTFYKDGKDAITPSSSNSFANKWVSTDSPTLTITCGSNDMIINSSDATDTKFRLHTDNYTLTIADGYLITGYSITGYAANGSPKINSTTVGTTSENATTVSSTSLSSKTASFTISGTASPWMYIKNLTVTIAPSYLVTYTIVDGAATVSGGSARQLNGSAPNIANTVGANSSSSYNNPYCTYSYYSDAACTTPISTISGACTVYAKVTGTSNVPVEFASAVDDENAQWYTLKLRDYSFYTSGETVTLSSSDITSASAQWVFTGSVCNAYVYNKDAAKYLVMSAGALVLSETPQPWILAPHQSGSGFYMYYASDYKFPFRNSDGVLAYSTGPFYETANAASFVATEVAADYSEDIVANVQPFFTTGVGSYFGLKTAVKEAYDDDVTEAATSCDADEYSRLLAVVSNPSNFVYPASGYYRIKNYSTAYYLGQNGSDPTIEFSNNNAASVLYLTRSGEEGSYTYTVNMQGANYKTTKNQATGNYRLEIVAPGRFTMNDFSTNTVFGYLYVSGTALGQAGLAGNASYWTLEDATTFSGSLTNARDNTATERSYATLCVPFAISALTGANAYIPTKDGDYIVPGSAATVSDGVLIAAGTPVLLIGAKDAGTYTATIKTGSAPVSAPTTNALTGTFTSTTIDTRAATGTNYVLGFDANNDNRIGFYHVNNEEFSLSANRAYLNTSGGNVKGFAIHWDDLEDGIQAVDNGQWTIDNAVIYNLAGQRMSKLQKGVNIVNGKKVLVK